MSHQHKCANPGCGAEWTCTETSDTRRGKDWKDLPFEKCPVTTAAKSNGTGPFCRICYYLEMAARHADLKGNGTLAKVIRGLRA